MAARPGKQNAARPAPRLRRAYHECRYGQLHLHNAIPGGGGFDELTSVICLHGDGETGRVFAPLLAVLGEARSVYAPDLPGAGESDPAPAAESAEAAVHAVADFADSMRIRSFDLVARGSAAGIALRLRELRPAEVRRVVLLAPPGAAVAGVLTLSAAETASPGLGPRLVEVLGRPHY